MKPADENEVYTGKMPAPAVRVVVDLSYDSPSSITVKGGLDLDEISALELHLPSCIYSVSPDGQEVQSRECQGLLAA